MKYPARELAKFIKGFSVKEMIIDENEQIKLVRKYHSEGHFGVEKVFTKMYNQGYYWPAMRSQIIEAV